MKLKFGRRILSSILCGVLFLNNFSGTSFSAVAYADETIGTEEVQSDGKKTVSDSLDCAYLTKFELLESEQQESEDDVEKINYVLGYDILTTTGELSEDAKMEIEFLLPVDESIAGWDMDSMNLWLEPEWTLETKERTFDFDEDGTAETAVCQVLKGTLNVDAPSNGTLHADICVNQGEAEQVVDPVFTAWMEHNQAGEEELGTIEASGNELPCQEHGKVEQITCIARTLLFEEPLDEESMESAVLSDCSAEISVVNVTTTEGETATDHVTKYIDYELNYAVTVSSSDAMDGEILTVEMLLPLAKERAVWGTEMVEQLLTDGWGLVTEERTADFNGDGSEETAECQILRGTIFLDGDTTGGSIKTAINVKNMEDGQTVQPVFLAWIGQETPASCIAEAVYVCCEPLDEVEGIPEGEYLNDSPSILSLSSKEVVDFEVAVEEPVLWNKNMADYISISKLLFDDGTSEIKQTITVTSPGWPDYYASGLTEAETAQIIEIPGATQLKITFDSSSQTESVKYDWIVGYDREGKEILEKLGGTDFAGKTYTIDGDYIKLAFRSDGSVNFKGFSATIEVDELSGEYPITIAPSIVPETYEPFEATVSLDGTNLKKTISVQATDAIWVKEIGAKNRSDIKASLYLDGRLVLEGTGSVYNSNSFLEALCDTRIKKVLVGEGITDIGQLCRNMKNMESISLPNSLVSISGYAFYGCSSLQEIKIPSGVTSIGSNAFYRCSSLQEIEIPSGVTSISGYAFYGCSSLQEIEIPSGVTSISSYAFYGCSSLQEIEIPSGVTSISGYAFYGCSSLQEIEIPSGVTSIGSSAFSECSSLQEIEIPDSVTEISGDSFYYCNSIKKVIIGTGLTNIPDYLFYYTKIEEILIPDNVIRIGLQSLPATLKKITTSASALSGNIWNSSTVLQEAILTGGILSDQLFAKTTLEKLTIDGNLERTTENALLANNAKLPLSVHVTSQTNSIDDSFWKAAAKRGLRSLTFEGKQVILLNGISSCGLSAYKNMVDGTYYIDSTGNFWLLNEENQTATLALVAEGQDTISIPAAVDGYTVTGLAGNAFTACRDICSVKFEQPENITMIDANAFLNCKKLTRINGLNKTSQINALFADTVVVGMNAYSNTGLEVDHEQYIVTKDALVYTGGENNTISMTIKSEITKTAMEEQNGEIAKLYTGESYNHTISLSNNGTASTDEFRVYLQMSDVNGGINYGLGSFTLEDGNGKQVSGVISKDSNNRYCIAFQNIPEGAVVVLNVSSSYGSPNTGGGDVFVWGEVVEAGEQGGALPNKVQQATWETKADDWTLGKKRASEPSPYSMESLQGMAYVSNLNFSYSLTRASETLQGVGKDYMQYVDFTDTLTLPDGFFWNVQMVDAVENGEVFWSFDSTSGFYTTIEGEKVLLAGVYSGRNASIDPDVWSIRFVENNGKKQLQITWRVYSTDLSKEINNISEYPYIVSYGKQLIAFDTSKIEPNTKVTFLNEISADQKFSYSENQWDDDVSCSSTMNIGDAKLSVSKNYKGGSTVYSGDPLTYVIAATNTGVYPYNTYQKMEDILSNRLYIEPKNIETMFASETFGSDVLTITISKASLYQPLDPNKYSVTNTLGTTIEQKHLEQSSAASQQEMKTSCYEYPYTAPDDALQTDAVITMTKVDDAIQVKVNKATYAVGKDGTLEEIFGKIGYMPTSEATYRVEWNHVNTKSSPYIIYPGQKLEYTIPATAKNIFMLMSSDCLEQFNSSWAIYNYAKAYDVKDKEIASDYCRNYIDRDFTMRSAWTYEGKNPSSELNVPDNSILDHTITVNKSCKVGYEALPIEKLLAGTQVLLVEVNVNPALSSLGLKTVAQDGVTYYILNKEGTYENVSINGNIADQVTVKATDDGMKTMIRWYENTGTDWKTIQKQFKTYVSREACGVTGTFYGIHGMAWLGDHACHRLYDPDYETEFSLVSVNKSIVTNAETSTGPSMDELEQKTFVKQGNMVTYRIQFSDTQNSENIGTEMTLTGTEIYDKLPMTISEFTWDKKNVTNLHFVNSDGTQEGIVIKNGDSWYVSGPEDSSAQQYQQYIRWNKDFSITFDRTVYLYVTLQFPEEADAWNAYLVAYGGTNVENTFFLRGIGSSVEHVLADSIEVWLSKGVSDAGYLSGNVNGNDSRNSYQSIAAGNSKAFYSVSDSHKRLYEFYAALYNAGDTKLYIDTLYDVMPEGFSFVGMPSGYGGSYLYYGIGAKLYYSDYSMSNAVSLHDPERTEVAFKNCSVTSSVLEDGKTIAFSVTGNKNYNSYIGYDEELQKWYLNPGEAIVIPYTLTTSTDDTILPEIATNAVMMSVYDPAEAGVQKANIEGVISKIKTEKTPNDGVCTIKSSDQIKNDYGVTGGVGTTWVSSEVELIKGDILPGITVTPVAAVDHTGNSTTSFDSVTPQQKVIWDLDVVNTGSETMKNYAVTDVMPAPYEFEGDVDYQIKGSAGDAWLSGTLFTIGERTENETEVVLELYDGTKVTYSLEALAQGVEIPIRMKKEGSLSGVYVTSTAKVILKKDADGKAVMTVEFPDTALAVPEGGSAKMKVMTANPTGQMNNKVYYNDCYITPLEQEFEHGEVSPGNYTKYEGQDSVTNSNLLTVAYGFVSTATKQVQEIEPDGTVVGSTAESSGNNLLKFENPRDNYLRYTLVVNNTTTKPLSKLVLIDSLPAIGDKDVFEDGPERGSEYRICFADEVDLKVLIWDKDHTQSTQLTPDQYQVSFSAANEGFTKLDWNCDSSTATVWTAQPSEDSQTIRIAVLDDAGKVIEKDTIIEVSFNAKADMSQFHEDYTIENAAGKVAYNNVGYHYQRYGETFELEATTEKVAVQLPCIPKLQKITVDNRGKNSPVEEDRVFTFLVHEGVALDDYTDLKKTSNTLKGRNSKAALVTLTVKAGESVSEEAFLTTKLLKPSLYDPSSKQWVETGETWTWNQGSTYTIAEIEIPHDYASASFGGGSGSSITFTHDSGVNKTYKCKNTLRYGAVTVTKYDSDGNTPLPGVTFSISSNGVTTETRTSGSDGKLSFENLPVGTYTITEIETVEGRSLLPQPITVTIPLAMTEDEIQAKENETGVRVDLSKAQYDNKDGKYYFYEFGFAVTNSVKLDLPRTGGSSTLAYIILVLGFLLLAACMILVTERYRRKCLVAKRRAERTTKQLRTEQRNRR